MLGEAVTAVDGTALGGLEGNFALDAAVGAGCLVELTGTVVVGTGTAAGISVIHFKSLSYRLSIQGRY